MRRLLLGAFLLACLGLGAGVAQGARPAPVFDSLSQAGVPAPAPDPAVVARGEQVFHEQIVCTLCHTLDGDGRGTAVELKTVGHRLAYLAQTQGQTPAEVMEGIFNGAPAMVLVRSSMSDQQVADVAAYLTTLLAPLDWDTSFTMDEAVQGLGVFTRAGCTACHTVSGVGATARDEAIPLVGVRQKNSQELVEGKLERIGAGPPGQGMRDAWASVSPEDRRALLAFLYYLD